MKKLLAVGAITVMVSMSAFGQAPETKTPPKKKPAGSASHGGNQKLVTPVDKTGIDPQATTTIQPGGSGGNVSINPQPLPPRQQKRSTSVGDKVSLNPQPLPPKPGDPAAAGGKVSINPQPLPPKTAKTNGAVSAGSKVSLNPQPLPPKTATKTGAASAGSKVSLNPQPLPPKTATKTGAASAGSKVSLNPQPLPPKQNVGAVGGQAKQ